MSMLGVGVGFDTEGAFGKEILLRAPRVAAGENFVVEDSRQGWVAAFRRVLDAFVGKDTLPESFDYSAIRPAGSPIKGFGGVAPGPEPLQKLIERTRLILDEYVKEDKPVDSRLIVDVMNFAGAAVVAGGVRRSAEIAVGRPDDLEYVGLKTSDTIENPELARWASNNSVFAKVGMNYGFLAEKSATVGEPGYIWLENARAYGRTSDGVTNADRRARGTNPCGEQTLESYETCCLVETFPSLHASLDEYKQTLKYAYLYAKSVTLMPTHDPRTNAVMFRNRRIGLSQTGIIENVNRVGLREHLRWCEEGYKEVRRWDDVYSDWLCIPRSIKVTTVKPSGTVSLLPGVTPGIHFPHSEHYIRRIRVSKNSDVWEHYHKAGYEVVQDVYADNTMVIEFPVKENNFTRGKDDVSMWEQFALAAALQRSWSDNAVSITVTIQPSEAKDLANALSMYETQLKSVSFLPVRGDEVYKLAPYESITADQYKERVARLKAVNFDAVEDVDKKEERFCDGEVCTL
jgi:ribonucleoside-triphosphate reductase (thioredoxin)